MPYCNMQHKDIKQLYRKYIGKDKLTLLIASSVAGRLEARPQITYKELVVEHAKVLPISWEDKQNRAGAWQDAELKVAFELIPVETKWPIDFPARDLSLGKLDERDRIRIDECIFQNLGSEFIKAAGFKLLILYLKKLSGGEAA